MTINPIFPIKNEQQGEVYIRKDTTKLKFWSHVAPSIFPRAENRPTPPVKNTNGGIMKRLKPQ